MLKELLNQKLVDYVAMDIKSPVTKESYSKIVGVTIEGLLEKVKESIRLLMESETDYEFRTTVIPIIHELDDIKQICYTLKGCRKYVLQKFDVGIGKSIIDPKFISKALKDEEMLEFLNVAQEIIPSTKARGMELN